MKNHVCLLICFFILIADLQAQKQLLTPNLKPLIGCWNDAKSKEFRFAFFENFAVYDNNFWEYQSLSSQKNKTEIILKKGAETLKLKVALSDKADSICTIAPSSGEKCTYIRYSKAPDFITDTQYAFVDNGYKEDSVTIIGYLRHANQLKTFNISVPSYFSKKDEIYTAQIDSLGRFRITIPLINTTQVLLDCREDGMFLSIVLEAGETFFLFCDYADQDVRFMGRNSRFKQELANYDQYLSNNPKQFSAPSYDARMEHDSYLREHQKIYAKDKIQFEEYVAQHPSVSHKFRTYQQGALLMRHACLLMQRHFELRTNFNKEQLSPTFMEYVRKLYRQIPQPYTLHRDVASFLRNYLDYYNTLGCLNVTLGIISVLRYADKKKEYTLTEQQKSDLTAYECLLSDSIMGREQHVDSLKIEVVIAPYKEQTGRAISLLQDSTVVKLFLKFEPILPQIDEIKQIDSEMICFDSVAVPPVLKELIISANFCKQFYERQTAFQENSIEYFKTLVNNESFRRKIMEQQEKFVRLEQQDDEGEGSFKNTDHLKEVNNVEELFKSLTAPYQGKVIYLDFWGTWCSPCKKEMKYVPAIKDAFRGKDIVFMYLANNSPDVSWRNVIKENHLTGSNVVHYNLPREQQDLLEKGLSIKNFPTFMLIDKEGNLVEKNAPAPSNSEELLQRITLLLAQ